MQEGAENSERGASGLRSRKLFWKATYQKKTNRADKKTGHPSKGAFEKKRENVQGTRFIEKGAYGEGNHGPAR